MSNRRWRRPGDRSTVEAIDRGVEASSTVGVLAALFSAAGAAAIVHRSVGSSAGRPSLGDVRLALADLKVGITELGAADRQYAGLFSVAARGADGSDLSVRLYGRDAHDAAGVTEGGLIFGLTTFGVPQEVAFAVMLYRLSTFYTPPIWGSFSLRWLERRRYL